MARLPKPPKGDQTVCQTSNIIELHREPIERLRLTEEEISHSDVVQSFKESHDRLIMLFNQQP
ncbi:hypothetical protein O9993_03325 [Vibrio lentus]|nr:hypothetical protein [Vibrio lentus]